MAGLAFFLDPMIAYYSCFFQLPTLRIVDISNRAEIFSMDLRVHWAMENWTIVLYVANRVISMWPQPIQYLSVFLEMVFLNVTLAGLWLIMLQSAAMISPCINSFRVEYNVRVFSAALVAKSLFSHCCRTGNLVLQVIFGIVLPKFVEIYRNSASIMCCIVRKFESMI